MYVTSLYGQQEKGQNAVRAHKNFFIYFPLAGATLIYFCVCLQKVIVPGATFQEIQTLFAMDVVETIRLGAAFYFVYAALQLAGGPLADRFGGARVITASGVLFVLGSFLSAIAATPSWLLAGRIVAGAGAALIVQALLKMTAMIAGDKLSVVYGVVTMLGYAGSIIGTSPFIAGVRTFGYRTMMLTAALLAGAAYILHWAGGAATAASPSSTASFSWHGWFRCFSGQNVLFFFAMGIPFATTFSFLTIFGKKFLEDYARMTPSQSGGILLGMTLIAAVNGVVAAMISRRFGNNHMMIMRYSSIGSLVITAVGTALLALGVRSAAPCGFCALALASTGNILPVYVAYLRENNDPDHFVTVNSLMNGCAYVLTSFFAWWTGKVLGFFTPENIGGVPRYGQNAYLAIMTGLLIFSAVSVVCTFCLHGKRREKALESR